MKFRTREMQDAYTAAGYRERYAMEHGNRAVLYVHGQKCYKFTYSQNAEYQDGNGATYNTVSKSWID